MKALVTGATGFIGSHLVRHLLDHGWEVDITIRDADEPVTSDIASRTGVFVADNAETASNAVSLSRPQVIAHLATLYLKSHTSADLGPLVQSNIEFGVGVLDAAARINTRVVLASSFFQFRNSLPAPITLYAATKQALSDIAGYYRRECNLDVREVVLFETYGPNDQRDKLVPSLVKAAHSGARLHLGSPDQLLRFVFVDDVVAGIRMLLTHEPPVPSPTAICDCPITVENLVTTCERAAGKKLDVVYNNAASATDLPIVAGDWPPPPGWAPETSLLEGLQACLTAAHEH